MVTSKLLFYKDYTQDGTGDVDTPKVIGQGGWLFKSSELSADMPNLFS